MLNVLIADGKVSLFFQNGVAILLFLWQGGGAGFKKTVGERKAG